MTDFEVRFGDDTRWTIWRGRLPSIVQNAEEALRAIGVKR